MFRTIRLTSPIELIHRPTNPTAASDNRFVAQVGCYRFLGGLVTVMV